MNKYHNAAAAFYALSPSTGMIKLSLGCVFLFWDLMLKRIKIWILLRIY